MSGLTYLSERAVEGIIEQMTQGCSLIHIMAPLSENQRKDLLALMWFGHSKNANFGFAWHRDHYQPPLQGQATLSAADLRRGLMRLRAEAKMVYSAA